MSEPVRPYAAENPPGEVFHVKQFDLLCSLVRLWNGTIRLVSPHDMDVLENRHVANSLALVPLIEQFRPSTIIDVGSGGGFPGLVVAVATGIPIRLIEADRRKAEFLRAAVRQLGVAATVHVARAETLDIVGDLVIARAVAPLPVLWTMTRALVAPGGAALFLKGTTVIEEVRNLGAAALLWWLPDGTVVEMHR